MRRVALDLLARILNSDGVETVREAEQGSSLNRYAACGSGIRAARKKLPPRISTGESSK